jgi:hypothetical protein
MAEALVTLDYIKSHPGNKVRPQVFYSSKWTPGDPGREKLDRGFVDLIDYSQGMFWEISSTARFAAGLLGDLVERRMDAQARGWDGPGAGNLAKGVGAAGSISAGTIPISLDYSNPDPGQIVYKMSWKGPTPALREIMVETALVRQEIAVLVNPPAPIPHGAPNPHP